MFPSDSPATGPAAHSTRIARIASMHCPKVSARTATPVSTIAMSWTPGSPDTWARLSSRFGVPLSVGARQTIVGSASLTRRSVVNVFLPVTASSASSRFWPTPTTRNALASLRVTSTLRPRFAAAALASWPYVALPPPGAWITPPLAISSLTWAPSKIAAASSNAPLATAAATLIGVYVDVVVDDPPVSWLKSSSGRASASVTFTLLTGSSSSSAMIIAVEVMIPWPFSDRGSANDAVPSVLTVTVTRLEVGRQVWSMKSLRS